MLAAVRMRALVAMQIEDRRRVNALALERFPAAGFRARHR
jgi:hypothetical protein